MMTAASRRPWSLLRTRKLRSCSWGSMSTERTGNRLVGFPDRDGFKCPHSWPCHLVSENGRENEAFDRKLINLPGAMAVQ
jgi:hypothetical protein